MKKYIGFTIVAGLIFSFSLVNTSRAETGVSGDASVRTSVDLNFKEGNTMGADDWQTQKRENKDKREDWKEEKQGDRGEFRAELQAKRQAFIEKLKENRTAFLAELKARKEEWRTAQNDRKAKFCEKTREAFNQRFEVAITAIAGFQVKVGDMIIKLNAEGKDTTDATASLDLSKQKLSEAKAKLAEIKALVPEACENMTAETFEKIKLGARVAKDLLKESREYLHEAIKEVRSLNTEVRIEARTDVNVKLNGDKDNQ